MHGLGQAMDTMDFMKRAWAHFKVPTTFTPTMDVEELDERIANLRTVEQWLTMNLGLLRNTIQAMELQRATLAALQKMASNFEEVMRAPGAAAGNDAPAPSWAASAAGGTTARDADAAPNDEADAPPSEADESTRSGPSFPTSPFSLVNAFPFLTPSVTGLSSRSDNADAKAGDDSPARASDAARSRQGAPADRDAGPVRSHEERDPPEAATAEGAGGQGADSADPARQGAHAGGTAGGPDPLAWWRLLQSSFEQIAAAATAQPIGNPFGATHSGDDTAASGAKAKQGRGSSTGTKAGKGKTGTSGSTKGSKGTQDAKAATGRKSSKVAAKGRAGAAARAKAPRAGHDATDGKATTATITPSSRSPAPSSARPAGTSRDEAGVQVGTSDAPRTRGTARRSGR